MTLSVFRPALLFLSVFVFYSASGQHLYFRAYGEKTNPPVIYVHGGPRGNATLFEGTTARDLADQGFYVIAYDRRGEGRSIDTTATFTFEEAFRDLNFLLDHFDLGKVTILGHSFGGIVSTLYADAYPEKVERLILVGALFSQQETYDHILKTVGRLALSGKDTTTLQKIGLIMTLDKNGADYRKKCYEVAADYGYFRMPHPTPESEKMNRQYAESEFFKANIRNDLAPVRFYENESRVNIDTKNILRSLNKRGVKLYAIYGDDDRIFSEKQLADMKKITGTSKFYKIENCSHYPFVDQHRVFLTYVSQIMTGSK